MRRAYKFRVYPTCGQASRAALCLRDHQRMYNAALEERREAWKRRTVSIRYGQQSAQLKDIRAFDPEQGRWSFSSQQATLRRLDKAMAAFCRRCKAGQAPGYPRFKALDRWDSVEWPKDGDGCRWKPGIGRMYLQGAGHIKVHAHRAVEGRVKTISLKREGRRWYVVLSCEDVPARPLPATGRQVGVSMSAWPGSLPPATGNHPQPEVSSHLRRGTGCRTAGTCPDGTRVLEPSQSEGEDRRSAPPYP